MARFDWANSGVFDITGITDEQFKSHFNSMSFGDKAKILEDLTDETEDAQAKVKAIAFVTKAGELLLRIGSDLI